MQSLALRLSISPPGPRGRLLPSGCESSSLVLSAAARVCSSFYLCQELGRTPSLLPPGHGWLDCLHSLLQGKLGYLLQARPVAGCARPRRIHSKAFTETHYCLAWHRGLFEETAQHGLLVYVLCRGSNEHHALQLHTVQAGEQWAVSLTG